MTCIDCKYFKIESDSDTVQYICTYSENNGHKGTPDFWDEPQNDFWQDGSNNPPAVDVENKCNCFENIKNIRIGA